MPEKIPQAAEMSESVPDTTTLCLFRHLLEENKLQQKMMTEIIKNIFGFKRVKYKGGAKNDSLFHMLFGGFHLKNLSF